jgi:hypothetical protein
MILVQMMDCHIIVDVKRALRPNRRNSTLGEALMNASTIGFERPWMSKDVKETDLWDSEQGPVQ